MSYDRKSEYFKKLTILYDEQLKAYKCEFLNPDSNPDSKHKELTIDEQINRLMRKIGYDQS